MSAAKLTLLRQRETCEIALVEPDEIGIVGVGESTLPTMRIFNSALGITGVARRYNGKVPKIRPLLDQSQ